MIGDDLVNSYHLLLCCLDLVFGNALLCSNRNELIKASFRGVFKLNCVLVMNREVITFVITYSQES